MAGKVWTAAELEQMSPAEQDALFERSVITDLDQVPSEFLERVRERVQQRADSSERSKA
ncbi:MAG: hypothetical protein ACLFRV_09925 [Acidimicrobiales bacterium]